MCECNVLKFQVSEEVQLAFGAFVWFGSSIYEKCIIL